MELKSRIPGETAKAFALRIIRHNIVNLVLPPGSVISENELSKELGISRTPVREAIQELQQGRLIEVIPQKGSIIAKIDFSLIEETVFLRRVLETAVIEELCGLITKDQLKLLEQNIQLQEFYLDNPSLHKIFELDNEFHKSLFQMCGKERIYEVMVSMMGHFDRIRTMSLHSVKDIKVVTDHRAIVNILRMGDKKTAADLMLLHLSRYKLDQDEIRKKYPDYF